jgi:hypothetical protein
MKYILCTTAACLSLVTMAAADEVPPRAEDKPQQVVETVKQAEDCSQQVWPHISQACLRSGDKGITVRLVITERR